MQVLLTANLILDEILFYILMLLVLVFASCVVISKNAVNTILWFSAASMAIFALLVGGGVNIIGIISIITCISISASLFLMNSCYVKFDNEKQSLNIFSVYSCFFALIVSVLFLIIKSSRNVVEFKSKYYDSTMYLITALISIIFIITIFGFRVFHDKKN